MTHPSVAVVVGSPEPASRTLTAATRLAESLAGTPDLVLDLVRLGPELLDESSERVAGLVAWIGAADLVIVASPTYKGAYTGLLKLFLDRFDRGTGLRGLAVPLMLGRGLEHSLTPELTLRPVLTELGATVPGRGLYVTEEDHDNQTAYDDWIAATGPIVSAFLERSSPAPAAAFALRD
jgi:FMN reductase